MKCAICKKEIETTILGKIKGTFIRKGKNLIAVCSSCQKLYKDKLKEKI